MIIYIYAKVSYTILKNKMNDYGAYNCPSISRKNPRATY
ncbi:hypothetical protein BTHERMOSOX_646 [Bathymodiolus thermophilus thioautotrophic gill symbiont]|uniref:Uncharacterized protein n=1 Tax=Bathymodiolus thermophilus thioautotrophic gill symbiont TaxID=2360 RepID=A0A8H8XFE7_9GAMM|nr:hypothetical protein THERMOS_2137 [Bathymodiolus thermophilus thioautotrophic gill symbiont]SGZ73844.1 hypothetical protein BTHERMOSOX_646 [Bathymodiolus thermophilus thioautotrophic gill symbiont]